MAELTSPPSPPSDNNEPVARHNTRAHLEDLLGQMIEAPERREEISRQIDADFGQDKSMMILDMSGFSRTTQLYGIVSFLLMIYQMYLITKPCVENNHGVIVKREADNLFCLFDDVADAVRASQQIIRHLGSANMLLPESRRLYVSIGIGFGRILNIEDRDMFGDEMNLACKLGEDVAQKQMILLTQAARAQLQADDIQTQEETVSISGIALSYHVVQSEGWANSGQMFKK